MTPRHVVAGGLACALAVLACGKGAAPPPPKPECESREQCAAGLVCTEGKCAGCTRSRDCALTEACEPVQKKCVFKPCFGAECAAHEQCAQGRFCVQGLCLDPNVPLEQGGQKCAVQVCGTARDCNPGQRCNGRTFVCETDLGCTTGAPCPAGKACNATSGLCEPSCTEDTAQQICGALTPCIGGRCVQCAADKDCGPGLACNVALGRCEGPTACQTSRDCAVPLVCDRASGSCGPSRGPCSSNEQCAADERCDSRLGQCIPGACTQDRFAPNQSQAEAAPVAPGSYPQLTLCGRDEDWFKVELKSGDTVQIVGDTDPLGSFDLQLLDAQGRLLEEGSIAVQRVVGSTAAYYVRARTNDAAAFYGLRVQVAHGTSCAHNPPEQHPDAQSASSLPLGPTYAWAVCPGEATWFRIPAGVGKGVDVTAAVDPSEGAVQVALYDSDGTTLLARDATGSAAPHVAAGASKGGVFYLRVAGIDELVATRYDLTARLTQP